MGTFLPMFRSHGTDTPREIWNFGDKGTMFYDAIEKSIKLRYHLMPYIYSLADVYKRQREQSEKVDHVLYHLDGPAAIKHMDALMEIDGIDALQWTSGDAGPDGTLPDWDVIYDKAIAAGKSIWVKVYSGEFEDWIKNVDRIVKKYGSHSLFLLFPEMSLEQAAYLLDYADKNWSDVKGTCLLYTS